MRLVLILLTSYLIGALPFAYIVSKIFGKIDIRTKGSKNVGATNVLRILGPLPGIIVLMLDFLKGLIAIKITYLYFPDYIYLAGLVAIIGHCWPVYLKFKGGKGVATTLGVIFGIKPLYLAYLVTTWLTIFLLSKIVSLASLTSALFLPLILILRGSGLKEIFFISLYSSIIIYRHKSNIGRLLRGEEERLQISKKYKKRKSESLTNIKNCVIF